MMGWDLRLMELDWKGCLRKRGLETKKEGLVFGA